MRFDFSDGLNRRLDERGLISGSVRRDREAWAFTVSLTSHQCARECQEFCVGELQEVRRRTLWRADANPYYRMN